MKLFISKKKNSYIECFGFLQNRNMDTGYHWRSRAGVPERFVCPKMLEGISTGAITVVEDPVVIS